MVATVVLALCITVVTLHNVADAYTNHTVGGVAGWFFNSTTNKTSADYVAWASNRTFSLGDYLIFNTSTNQTVIQTYNKTTYVNCTMDESSDNDTFLYNGGNNQFGVATIIQVPLTLEGLQYYFSGAQDGEQCKNGMAFEIKVNHGIGLPPSLNQPPPPLYVSPPSPGNGDEEQPPIVGITPLPNGGLRSLGDLSWLRLMIYLMVYLGV
ncbi:cucumber peeling cupredoxin-like [Andrographis paniculata]|uniref:cucumber peeling cupredoxin-like n=1 Tax=Andrographis paniculata TaxID=175694 RepID=UPI0021E7579B|nr:cucumber peeling cupredoxin-like [Andrographis paniculata]